MTTTSIDLVGNQFRNFSMTCVFHTSIPVAETPLQRRQEVQRQPATYHNSTFVKCPHPPTLQPFFSSSDTSWVTNSTLLEDSQLEVSLEVGHDSYFIRRIPYHAVVKVTSIFPRSGPRKDTTEVIVDGDNFVNSTHLACKFGPVIGPSAEYLASDKVKCVSPHYPDGYGRAVVPVQIALNGVDFSESDDDMFEFHEPLVVKEITPVTGFTKGGTVVNISLDDNAMRLKAVSHQQDNLATTSRISPAHGPETGGNLVVVSGSGFDGEKYIACHFGEEISPAYYISNESVECIAPQATDNMEVNVAVSTNGIILASEQQLSYTYLPR